MKAMILAAGRGERMRDHFDRLPKPLIPVGNTTLIEHNIMQLKAAGITDIVINVSHMADKIMAALGSGQRYGVNITYSIEEGEPLETGGGVLHALPLLGEQPFVLIGADIWADYQFMDLINRPVTAAHLVLVDNPDYHSGGDFSLQDGCVSLPKDDNTLTYSSIAVLNPSIFEQCTQSAFPLSLVLKQFIADGCVSGEYYQGCWYNVGTPEELWQLQQNL